MIKRAFQLAELGKGSVAPNPMVGAVLVYENRIIGEGWHQMYGKAHAEVNAINSVKPEDRKYIPESTLYVTLEPCCIHGNTPPCTDLIIREKIKKVVISCNDDTPGVEGRSSKILREAGVEVEFGAMEEFGRFFARRRNVFVSQKRPYIILKWAESADGFIAKTNERTPISNALTNRLVHRWRAEEAAIGVGANTVLIDNPSLTVRYYHGKNPIRVLFNPTTQLPQDSNLFDGTVRTIVFTLQDSNLHYNNSEIIKFSSDENFLQKSFEKLYELKIQSILIEGGGQLLSSLIDAGLWDEMRIIQSSKMLGSGTGIKYQVSGVSEQGTTVIKYKGASDRITIFYKRLSKIIFS